MNFKSYENTGGGVMPEGDYEVICLQAVETTTKTSGLPVIKMDFQVRSDVDQAYQRKHIFKNFYQDDNGQWPGGKIGKLANALGIPEGETFELADLEGRCCILHMKPYTGNDGVERDSIFYSMPTKAGQMVQAAPTAAQGYEEVENEELPF